MRCLAFTLLVACGDDTLPVGMEPRNGTRLQLRWHVYADGARQPNLRDFHDGGRGELCSVTEWSDGRLYCTPTSGSTVFGDSACRSELGTITAGQPAPTYFTRPFSFGALASTSRLFRGAAKVETPPAIFILQDGECVPTGNRDLLDYYALAGEVFRDQLVRLRDLDAETTSRVGVKVLGSDDGMRLPRTLHDRELDIECSDDLHPTEPSCVPKQATQAEWFNDPDCTVPEAALPMDAPVESLISVPSRETGCTSYFSLGPHVGPLPLFQRIGGVCTQVEPHGEYLFIAGAPIEVAPLQRAPEVVESRRLQRILLTSGETTVASESMFDTKLGVRCDRVNVKGVDRCMPALVAVSRRLDSTCQRTIEVAEVRTRPCDPPIEFAANNLEITGPRISRLGDPVEVYQRLDDACVPYVMNPGFTTRSLGPRLPLDTFAAAIIE